MTYRCSCDRHGDWRFCPWCGQELPPKVDDHPKGTCRVCGQPAIWNGVHRKTYTFCQACTIKLHPELKTASDRRIAARAERQRILAIGQANHDLKRPHKIEGPRGGLVHLQDSMYARVNYHAACGKYLRHGWTLLTEEQVGDRPICPKCVAEIAVIDAHRARGEDDDE